MAIHRVGVIGAGTMGNGIAHVFARSGPDEKRSRLRQNVAAMLGQEGTDVVT